MKKYLLIIFLIIFCWGDQLAAQEIRSLERIKTIKWWALQSPGNPLKNKSLKLLSLIKVKGNRFVNSEGDTILFRGLAIADPDKLENEGQLNKDLFQRVKEMGATLVRIPVHPIAWRQRTPEKYLELLDQAIEWCTELHMYVIIDWHSIGNLKSGLFQDPMYITSLTETFDFWRTIARHFTGYNTVAFYEIFNEPTLYFGQLGNMTWDEWKKINEDVIKLIRAFDKETIPLVAGFDWAYDLTPLRYDPINDEGIGYVTHPYPHKRTPPWEPKWEEDFGFAAGDYPVFATELGFTLGNSSMNDNGDYGKTIINYLEKRGISWSWWVFDPQWEPKMFESWSDPTLTDNGRFFKETVSGSSKQVKAEK